MSDGAWQNHLPQRAGLNVGGAKIVAGSKRTFWTFSRSMGIEYDSRYAFLNVTGPFWRITMRRLALIPPMNRLALSFACCAS